MNRTSYFSEERSDTALALLALIAAGKSFDRATQRALRCLLDFPNDSDKTPQYLSIFSGHDEEEDFTEDPVIIPFAPQRQNLSICHNGFGTLTIHRDDREYSPPQLRVFSPDATDDSDDDDDDTTCLSATSPSFRIYAE